LHDLDLEKISGKPYVQTVCKKAPEVFNNHKKYRYQKNQKRTGKNKPAGKGYSHGDNKLRLQRGL
jgi:hypothetical protein